MKITIDKKKYELDIKAAMDANVLTEIPDIVCGKRYYAPSCDTGFIIPVNAVVTGKYEILGWNEDPFSMYSGGPYSKEDLLKLIARSYPNTKTK
jgi:hypothetical protein